jgi:hypothetical protein
MNYLIKYIKYFLKKIYKIKNLIILKILIKESLSFYRILLEKLFLNIKIK